MGSLLLNNLNNQLQNQLFQAARAGDIIKMRHLIANGANPFEFDAYAMTPLDYAIKIDLIKGSFLLVDMMSNNSSRGNHE